MLRIALLTTALVAPSQLWAQATPEGAAGIAASLQRFVPEAPGVLSVVPSGADYVVTLDIAPLLAAAPEGSSGSFSPLSFRLTPQDGGLYEVNYDQAVTGSVKVGDELDLSFGIERLVGGGLYDPALGAFLKQQAVYTGFSYQQLMNLGDAAGRSVYGLESMTVESTGSVNPDGGVDVVMSYVGTGVLQEFTMPEVPEMPPMNFVLKSGTYSGDGTITGAHSLPMLDLVAFAIAHMDTDKATAQQQAELKELLRAAGPFFESVEMTSSMDDVTVETGLGTFAAASLAVDVTINGAVTEGRFYERLAVSGLELPEGVLPEWAAALIPGDLDFAFDITGFDLASPLAILVNQVDFNTGPGEEFGFAMLQALLPSGEADINLALEASAESTYLLQVDGDISAGPMTMFPAGAVRVSLHGMDAIIENLRAGPPEIVQMVGAGIGVAQSLGRQEGDALVWDIELGEEGLFVNGNDVTAFLE